MRRAISELLKALYWPICRAYACHFVGDKPADSVYRFMCSLQFWMVNGFWPDFVQPRRFSEKLWSRMLHDRDPQLTLFSDKLRTRDYVAAKIGKDYLIPLIWKGDSADEIPFDQLPQRFVMKTNHGCGYTIIVRDKNRLNEAKARRQLKKWLAKNFCNDIYVGASWGYKNVKPCIIIEEFLEQNGIAPPDYKFWCFAGRVEIVSAHFDRFTGQKIRYFKRNLEQSELRIGPIPVPSGPIEVPQNYGAMLQIAECLAESFGFMRVDLYSHKNKVYFGELTPYAAGGLLKFHSVNLDFELGTKWKGR